MLGERELVEQKAETRRRAIELHAVVIERANAADAALVAAEAAFRSYEDATTDLLFRRVCSSMSEPRSLTTSSAL